MSKKYAYLFPGQGAQVVGMGKDFYESFALARETFDEAETILGRHLKRVVFEGPMEELTETSNSQTGIFVVSMATLRVLEQQFPQIAPVATAGLSLGEYTALVAAKRLSFEEALRLVDKRSRYMHEACEERRGTMAAIFGLADEVIEEMVEELHLPQDLWVANYNCPGQVVISGTLKGVEAGSEAALKRGAKRAIPLKVHGAFHSGLMQSASDRLAPYIEKAEILESTVPLAMNVPGGFVEKREEIRKNLILQVTHSVRWQQSVRAFGASVEAFLEIGCGKTLAGLNRQIGVLAPTHSINKITDLEQLASTM